MDRPLSRLVTPLLAFAAGVALASGLNRPTDPEAGPGSSLDPEPVREARVAEPSQPADPASDPARAESVPVDPRLEEPPPDPALVYRLLGTVASGGPAGGRAVVEHLFTGGTAEVRVGDRLAGAEILEIASGRIRLRRPDGEITEIQRQSPGRAPIEPALDDIPEVVPGASFAEHLAAEETRWIRDRLGGDMVANYEDGVLTGWVVTYDPDSEPNPAFERTGLQPGDRVTSLNGMDLTDPETLYFLSQIHVPFERLIFDVVAPDGTQRIGCDPASP